MDSITHTLFGLTTYATVKRESLSQPAKKALLVTALAASQIPDIDVVINLTEAGRINGQLWHRGITHSVFMSPVWALLISWVCSRLWKVKDPLLFKMALFNVLIHIFSDSLNTWGTGLLEPVSPVRVTFGTLSIVDFVIWFLILGGFLVTKFKPTLQAHHVYRTVWLLIGLHIAIQGIQGTYLLHQASRNYEEAALKAEFIPWQFTVVGKTGNKVELSSGNVWSGLTTEDVLYSAEHVDLSPLFQSNPKAKVLMAWSPFVVIVNDQEKLGVFDPRFYEDGESFLSEYIPKKQ